MWFVVGKSIGKTKSFTVVAGRLTSFVSKSLRKAKRRKGVRGMGFRQTVNCDGRGGNIIRFRW